MIGQQVLNQVRVNFVLECFLSFLEGCRQEIVLLLMLSEQLGSHGSRNRDTLRVFIGADDRELCSEGTSCTLFILGLPLVELEVGRFGVVLGQLGVEFGVVDEGWRCRESPVWHLHGNHVHSLPIIACEFVFSPDERTLE